MRQSVSACTLEHMAAQSGYLNAAVESGQRAAKEVLASLK
jgi:monoamine oxidase